MSVVAGSRAWLIPLPGGPPLAAIEMAPPGEDHGLIVGRGKDSDFRLPGNIESVSRRHAEFVIRQGQWYVADQGSRWGTIVNGMRIPAKRPVPLREGDLVRIHPWTFRFSTSGAVSYFSVDIEEDRNFTVVRTLSDSSSEPLRQDLLHLLLEAASQIQSAADETALAAVLTDIARRGTGLRNATVLRALDAEGNVGEPILDSAARKTMRFSRSLLAAASKGVVAEFSSATQTDVALSIVQENIRAAICAPLMTDKTVAAYLYLDSSGSGEGPTALRPNAAGFCQALARMGGLALANLKRIEVERGAALLESELKSAAEAQKWILPRAPVTAGPFTCAGLSRPGGYLGGDFFDAQVLAGGRLAVCLGDVSGHGAAASVLMTAAQGFLHAALGESGDLTRAVAGLNAFVQPRRPWDKFITLWIGLFDTEAMKLQYVDAGHGFGLLLKNDGPPQKLDENGGPPIGIDADFDYRPATISLAAGERVLVVSDGIVEQTSPETPSELPPRQFGLDGVVTAIQTAGTGDLVGQIFRDLEAFARGAAQSDDATAVLVQWL